MTFLSGDFYIYPLSSGAKKESCDGNEPGRFNENGFVNYVIVWWYLAYLAWALDVVAPTIITRLIITPYAFITNNGRYLFAENHFVR